MASFYSPDGNLEAWEDKPVGYFTVAEWDEAHPAPLPPPPTPAELCVTTLAEISAAFEAAIAPLLAGEPPSAVATYSEQRTEAEAYSADSSAATLMLDNLAAARRIDKDDLVQRVLVKSALHKQVSGLLLGQQQALADDVQAIMADDRLTELEKVVALEQLDITIGLPAAGD